MHQAPSPRPGRPEASRAHQRWALTVRTEAGVAGVAVGTAVGVGLVHGLIHHSCHPDGQVGGECEHETTSVWRERAKRPVRVCLILGVPGEVQS